MHRPAATLLLTLCLTAPGLAQNPPIQTPNAPEPTASEPAPAASAPPAATCGQLTARAMATDLKAVTGQSQNLPLDTLVKLYDEAIAQWTLTLAQCQGRAKERAQRNLDDNQKTREVLAERLQAGSQCESSHRDAQSLQDLARAAIGERRFGEAATLYRKAEGMWDLAADLCTGSQQQLAERRREQTEIDAHNAEFCAPAFERSRDYANRLRNTGAALPLAERQTQSQIAETLWRDAARVCKGSAQELATNNAQALGRERGTPWVATPWPGAPAAAAPASPNATKTAVPAAQAASAPAATRSLATAPAPRAAPAAAASLPAQAAVTAATTVAVAAAPATEAKLFDRSVGDTRYLGQFVREDGDVVSGAGRVEWKNGDVYEGPLVRSQRQGVGEIRWANGQRYKGDWVADQATGRGLMVYANGNQYEGGFVDGEPAGEGRLVYASGDSYTGQIRKGLPHGRGTYLWTNGQRYEGDWVNDQPQGQGQMRYANGNVYQGQMLAGRPHGRGRLVHQNGDVYEGEFDSGKEQGRGIYTWKSGERYDGGWLRGLKHGPGVFYWPSGDRWEGEFKDDERTPEGQFVRKGD
ncbi:MAG: hypothetical protein DI603_09745 [Roseateles depolymerans]|uniref:MORN repeat protein n=1 Tax=Roseateles depolymerans TaxID=76731 RepID=A0A2W5DQH1_9BURK|nr:MAG: hypothetical protein DI603_09745 [Roseateles depolymerans]